MTAGPPAVVLAAGQGTRMRSQTPKVLHLVAGRPLLSHVLDAVRGAGARPVVVLSSESEPARAIPAGQSSLFQVAFHPSGQSFAVCGADNLVKIYDLAGNDPLILRGHTRAVTSLAFSKDGRLLVTGSNDRTLRLWDMPSGQSLRVLHGQGEEVTALAISPDGSQIASAGKDQAIRLWDLDTTERYRQFSGNQGAVWAAAFSPDGGHLAAGGADRTIHVWRFSRASQGSNMPVQNLTGHHAAVTAIAYSRDGQWIVSCGGDKNDARFIGVGSRLSERWRRRGKIEAHVHNVGIMLNGVVESCNDIREIAGAVR